MAAVKNAHPDQTSPTAEEVRAARTRAGRTQAQAAEILNVSERQFQRWETAGGMPSGEWRRYTMTCGHRFPEDFIEEQGRPTRGWNPDRDALRDTIENGDHVHLQPNNGPMIQARVWLDRVHDGLTEGNYRGTVIDFPGRPDAGSEFGGFYIGERITFADRNVIHVEQASTARGPSGVTSR
jgi:DNA-binding XRE family transcriptional regulator